MAVISGTSGDDYLVGTSGSDTLNGGAGNDRLLGGAGADVLNGGDGFDWASYGNSTAGITLDLYDGSRTTGDAVGDTFIGIESYVGSAYNDLFIAGATATTFDGGGGYDVVDFSLSTEGITLNLGRNGGVVTGPGSGGLAQGDTIFDIDRIIGTNFNDLYILNNGAIMAFTEAANGGIDEVRTNNASLSLDANIENLTYTGTSYFSGYGNAANNVITGGSGDDLLSGDSGNDTLIGGAGNDRLIGGAGADVLDGGSGFDWASYQYSGVAITLDLYDGSRTTGEAVGDTYIGIESYVGSAYDDVFIAGATATTFDGGGGIDVVDYSLSTAGITLNLTRNGGIIAGPGSGGLAEGDTIYNIDRIIGTGFDDVYILNGDALIAFTEAANGGIDEVRTGRGTYQLDANLENLTYIGVADFNGYGNAGNNVLIGGSGIDQLDGQGGNDTLVGGAGNDRLIGGAGADVLNGGDGFDWASYSSSAGGITLDLYDGSRTTGDAVGDVFIGIESYVGSNFDDLFIAGATATVFDGGLGVGDTVDYSLSTAGITLNLSVDGGNVTTGPGSGGLAEGDTIYSIDRIIGTNFNDLYVLNGNAVMSFTEAVNGGIDEVRTGRGTYQLEANLENLTYLGANQFTGLGNASNNIIIGGSIADRLDGQGGNDTLIGGAGGDTLIGGDGFDLASYSSASGAVLVDLANMAANTGHAAGDAYSGIEGVVGSAFADTLRGASSADYLDGAAGNDAISGYAGDDVLIGGAGSDTIDGGDGTDTASYATANAAVRLDLHGSTSSGDAAGDVFVSIERYVGSSYNDTFVSGPAAHNLDGGSGTDTIDYSGSSAAVTVDLTAGSGGTGDAAGDVLTSIEKVIGSTFADTLSSSTSGHVLQGGAGDDIYIVGGAGVTISEAAGGGTDEVRTALASLSIASFANVESLVFTGTGAFNGVGNGGNNVITGGSAADVLDGRAGDDTLTGGAGDDRLIGGAGADLLSGGDGTDAADYSTSAAAVAVDLTTGVVSGGDATGDALVSIEKAIGSSLADTLSSSTSGHVLQGGAGNDIYLVGDAGVTIVESSGGGTDEVRTELAGFTIATAANVENLVFTGTGDFAGTGNAGNNFLVGGSGNDTLNGGDGNDVLAGGSGADVLAGGNGTDAVDYSASSAAVTVDLTAAAASGGDADGDTLASIEKVIGSSFADTLSSSTGGHVLQGGAGDDIYLVGNAGVTISEAAGGGTDEVRTALASLTIASAANVENLTFTGTGGFVGTGNGGNNIVTGGSGDDLLDGRAGDDVLIGGLGDDRLIGGAGADTLSGGDGIDTADYASSVVAVTVDLTTGGVSGGDADGDTLASIEKVIGSVLGDTLASSTSGHVLEGGAGDDVYLVGDAGVSIVEFSGGGTDEVRTGLASFTLSTDVDNLVFTGAGDVTGTGNNGDNVVAGGSGNDTIDGQAGDDTLVGGGGNDFLFGGDGDDMLSFSGSGFAHGGEGGDVYDIAQASGIVYVDETGVDGFDTVLLNAQDAADVEYFRVGDDLHITNKADMTDSVQDSGVVLTDWFNGGDNVEAFITTDGLHFVM